MSDSPKSDLDRDGVMHRVRALAGLGAIGIVLAVIAALVALAIVFGLVKVVVWWFDGLAAGG